MIAAAQENAGRVLSEVRFSVAGTPVPQGSKVARVVGKCIKVGGQYAVLGARAVMTEISDMKTKTRPSGALTRWREAIALVAARAHQGEPFEGPVELWCEFVLPRPKSHWTKSGRLTKSAPRYPGKPDLSKLVRAVEDALTGIVYRDDAQVVSYGDTSKRYAGMTAEGEPGVGGVRVVVRDVG